MGLGLPIRISRRLGSGYGYGGGRGSRVAEIQSRLARAGYYHGAIDGIMGPATQKSDSRLRTQSQYGRVRCGATRSGGTSRQHFRYSLLRAIFVIAYAHFVKRIRKGIGRDRLNPCRNGKDECEVELDSLGSRGCSLGSQFLSTTFQASMTLAM